MSVITQGQFHYSIILCPKLIFQSNASSLPNDHQEIEVTSWWFPLIWVGFASNFYIRRLLCSTWVLKICSDLVPTLPICFANQVDLEPLISLLSRCHLAVIPSLISGWYRNCRALIDHSFRVTSWFSFSPMALFGFQRSKSWPDLADLRSYNTQLAKASCSALEFNKISLFIRLTITIGFLRRSRRFMPYLPNYSCARLYDHISRLGHAVKKMSFVTKMSFTTTLSSSWMLNPKDKI